MTEPHTEQAAKPEPAAGKAETKAKPATAKARAAAGRATLPIWLLLPLLVLLAAGLGWLWQEQQQLAGLEQQTLTRLNEAVGELHKQQQQEREQTEAQFAQLREQHEQLARSFSALLKASAHLRSDWLITEAEYLLKLANHRLLLERDVQTAMVAIQAADERLREVADPALLKVRQRIANDLNALRAVAQPDLSGLSFRLSALAGDISQLPLNTPDPHSIARRADARQAQPVGSWQELPAAVWQDLKSLIVIRQHDDPVQPLLAPEQRFYLVQNLHLQLEQARLALLNGHAQVYRERLQQADAWVNTYFDKDDPLTRHVRQQLQELSAIDIMPELPDLSGTYQLLRELHAAEAAPRVGDSPASNGAAAQAAPPAETEPDTGTGTATGTGAEAQP